MSWFTGSLRDPWAYAHGVKLDFIRPGKPVENAVIESFNGWFRDECLNAQVFISLHDAQRSRIERRGEASCYICSFRRASTWASQAQTNINGTNAQAM